MTKSKRYAHRVSVTKNQNTFIREYAKYMDMSLSDVIKLAVQNLKNKEEGKMKRDRKA